MALFGDRFDRFSRRTADTTTTTTTGGSSLDGGGDAFAGLRKIFGDSRVDRVRKKLHVFDPFSMRYSSGGGAFGSGRKSMLSRRDGFKFT